MFSFRYVLRETGQNLWRNILLAVATVVTVGVSLAMFGGFMLFQVAVDSATARWQDGVEFIVWMNTDAGTDEDSSVRNQLDESPGVERWEYVDRQQSYEEFREFFEDTPEVLEIFTAEGVPPYYRVVPNDPDPDVVEELGSQFKGKPGVRTVTFAGDVDPRCAEPVEPGRTRAVHRLDRPARRLDAADPQHAGGGHRQPASRDRDHAPGGRDQVVHPCALHARGAGAGSARRH